VVRHYIGNQTYTVEKIGTADDKSDADGVAVLNFGQAQTSARERMVTRAHEAAGVANGPLTVKQVIIDYLDWLEAKGKTAYDTRTRAEAHILPSLGELEVGGLTTKILHDWHVGLAKALPRIRTHHGKPQQHRKQDENGDTEEWKRKRRSTANRLLTILKAALNRAWKEGKVASNTAWARVERFRAVEAARIRYLTVAESQRVINASTPDFRQMVQAALQTGCRYSELTRLQVADYNPDAGTLHVRQSKSGKARHVVLTDEGQQFFADLCAGRSGSEAMLRKDNGEAWKASQQILRMMAASERAKLDPPANFHSLRHTWASHAVMNGVPLLVVARNLGHGDTRMVEKHYGHLAPSYIADAIRAGAPRFGYRPDPAIARMDRR
jgi:integrase